MNTIIGADAAKLAGLQMDLLGKIRQGKISLESFEQFIRGELVHKTDGKPVVKKKPKPGTLSWDDAQAYLCELAGLSAELVTYRSQYEAAILPNRWQVVMPKGLTYALVAKVCRKLKVWLNSESDLQAIDLDKEQRDPNRDGTYAVSFKASQEADEENANQSANDRQAKNCQDITVLERLWLGLVYFLVTGRHLDERTWTLCTGSRCSDGFVPGVRWVDGFRVDWFHPDVSHDCLRARSVVSLPVEQTQSA
jgi:hypothetical protein